MIRRPPRSTRTDTLFPYTTLFRSLMVNLTPANISDSAGAQAILDAIRKRWPWVKHLFADGAYDRTQLMAKAAFRDFVIEVVRRIAKEPGFKVLPRRWEVERTFGWRSEERRVGTACVRTRSMWWSPDK